MQQSEEGFEGSVKTRELKLKTWERLRRNRSTTPHHGKQKQKHGQNKTARALKSMSILVRERGMGERLRRTSL
jgi:hypothetical protein